MFRNLVAPLQADLYWEFADMIDGNPYRFLNGQGGEFQSGQNRWHHVNAVLEAAYEAL